MRRPLITALLPLLLAAAPPASQPAPALYTITGTAKQSGNIYLLKLTILKTDGQLRSEIVSRPAIQMKDGQSAEIMVGTDSSAGVGAAPPPAPEAAAPPAPFTGYKLTAIKPTSSRQILYLFTVVDHDQITYAATGTLAPEPAQTQP